MPTRDKIDAVWDKAKKVRGENPDNVRQDSYGNMLRRDQFGRDTRQGWEIDHWVTTLTRSPVTTSVRIFGHPKRHSDGARAKGASLKACSRRTS